MEDDREASIRATDFGPVRICQVSLGRHLIVQEHVALSDSPSLKFFFQEEGTAFIRQCNRMIELRAGEWCALRKDLPHVMGSSSQSRQLALSLPCSAIDAPRPGFAWWGKARTFLSGAGQILHASSSAAIIAGRNLDRGDTDILGMQFVQLLEIMLRTGDQFAAPDMRERRRAAALAYIESNLDDPDLGIEQIARALNCSARTIHKCFEGEAQTIGRAIWDRRLERCRGELVDPSTADCSITEIAHRWGFSDSQHFSRAFRQRYGLTPRECRNRALLN